jgi:hypothetical protein
VDQSRHASASKLPHVWICVPEHRVALVEQSCVQAASPVCGLGTVATVKSAVFTFVSVCSASRVRLWPCGVAEAAVPSPPNTVVVPNVP